MQQKQAELIIKTQQHSVAHVALIPPPKTNYTALRMSLLSHLRKPITQRCACRSYPTAENQLHSVAHVALILPPKTNYTALRMSLLSYLRKPTTALRMSLLSHRRKPTTQRYACRSYPTAENQQHSAVACRSYLNSVNQQHCACTCRSYLNTVAAHVAYALVLRSHKLEPCFRV